jgi:hypothetical protein
LMVGTDGEYCQARRDERAAEAAEAAADKEVNQRGHHGGRGGTYRCGVCAPCKRRQHNPRTSEPCAYLVEEEARRGGESPPPSPPPEPLALALPRTMPVQAPASPRVTRARPKPRAVYRCGKCGACANPSSKQKCADVEGRRAADEERLEAERAAVVAVARGAKAKAAPPKVAYRCGTCDPCLNPRCSLACTNTAEERAKQQAERAVQPAAASARIAEYSGRVVFRCGNCWSCRHPGLKRGCTDTEGKLAAEEAKLQEERAAHEAERAAAAAATGPTGGAYRCGRCTPCLNPRAWARCTDTEGRRVWEQRVQLEAEERVRVRAAEEAAAAAAAAARERTESHAWFTAAQLHATLRSRLHASSCQEPCPAR